MKASNSEACISTPKENAARGKDGKPATGASYVICLCDQLEQINRELATLNMPEEENDLAVSERVVELVEKRRALFRETVFLPRLLPAELPRLLQTLIDHLKGGEMVSCRDKGELEDTFKGLRRVANGLRQICPTRRTRSLIKQAAESAIKRQTWHGDDTIMAVQSRTDGTSDFVYAGVSEAWCDFLGYEPGEAIGMPLRAFMTRDGLQRYTGKFLATLRRNGCVQGEIIELRSKVGQIRRVKVNVVGETDDTGRLVRTFGANRPVFQI